MFEDFSQYHGVEEAGHRLGSNEVTVDQSGAGAHLIRFFGQQLASEVKGVRVDLHTRNVETAAREQQLQYALAAPHVQHARSAHLVGHPVDSTAENVAGGAPVEYAEVHLGDLIPHMFMCGRRSILCIYHASIDHAPDQELEQVGRPSWFKSLSATADSPAGAHPVNRLPESRRRCRLAPRLPSSDGIDPLSRLLWRFSWVRPEIWPSSVGIDPLNPLLESHRLSSCRGCPAQTGIVPLNRLLCRYSASKLES